MKKIIYIAIAILVICIIVILIGMEDPTKKENTMQVNSNVLKNEVLNTIKNEVLENKVENEVENNIVEEPKEEKENTVPTETFDESPETSEEKGINIVKKDWGETNNVKFSIEGIDQNGNYIIVVRNNQTEALAFYTVNVQNGTFTKKEMN